MDKLCENEMSSNKLLDTYKIQNERREKKKKLNDKDMFEMSTKKITKDKKYNKKYKKKIKKKTKIKKV